MENLDLFMLQQARSGKLQTALMLSLLLGFPFPTEKVDLITGSTRRPRAPTTELWASGGAPALTNNGAETQVQAGWRAGPNRQRALMEVLVRRCFRRERHDSLSLER